MKITDAILILLGEGNKFAAANEIASRINSDPRFKELKAKW